MTPAECAIALRLNGCSSAEVARRVLVQVAEGAVCARVLAEDGRGPEDGRLLALCACQRLEGMATLVGDLARAYGAWGLNGKTAGRGNG